MPTRTTVQYTIRGVPRQIDEVLRRKARQRGVSLNQMLVDELCAAGGGGQPRRFRHIADLGARWQDDPEFDRALSEQRRIDRDLWK